MNDATFPTIWVWVGFGIALVLLLFLDLVVLTRRNHKVGIREASYLTAFWTVIAVLTGVWIWIQGGGVLGAEYFTAYVAEQALSIDNLFVFLIIFRYFKLPEEYRGRALLFGIVAALVTRAIFIAGGLAIIGYFSWFLFILGAFLIYTGYKIAFASDNEVDPSQNLAVRLFRRVMPVSDDYDHDKLLTRTSAGALAATPFLLVVVALATTDIVFAVDSIPTVFGISTNPFIVWSSNAMAILGLRHLFFLLERMVNLFRFLKYGLALILVFIGANMIIEETLHQLGREIHVIGRQADVYLWLGAIVAILIGSIIASVLLPQSHLESESEKDSSS